MLGIVLVLNHSGEMKQALWAHLESSDQSLDLDVRRCRAPEYPVRYLFEVVIPSHDEKVRGVCCNSKHLSRNSLGWSGSHRLMMN